MRQAWLLVLVMVSTGCGSTEPSPERPAELRLNYEHSWPTLSAVAGTAAPVAVTVRLSVEPAGAYPIVEQVVHFTAAQDHLSADSVVTDAYGRASVTWTPGTTAGDRSVYAVASVQGAVAHLAVPAHVSPGPIVRGDLAPMFTGPSTSRQLKTVDTVHVGRPYSDPYIYTAFYDAYDNQVTDLGTRELKAKLGSGSGLGDTWPVTPRELGLVNLYIWIGQDPVPGVARQLFVIPNPTGSRLLDSDITGTWRLTGVSTPSGICGGPYPMQLPLIAGGVELSDGWLDYTVRGDSDRFGKPWVRIDPRNGATESNYVFGTFSGTMLSNGTFTGTSGNGVCTEQVRGEKVFPPWHLDSYGFGMGFYPG